MRRLMLLLPQPRPPISTRLRPEASAPGCSEAEATRGRQRALAAQGARRREQLAGAAAPGQARSMCQAV